jgi:hypothetical protein
MCRLEPAKDFNKALVTRSGKLGYDYYRLIEVTMRVYCLSKEDARDWVDFNIVNLPKIKIH